MPCRFNHGHLLPRLLELGADINAIEHEHGYTSLCLALVLGYEWFARTLVRCGARLDIPCHTGRMALFIAIEKGMAEFVYLAITSNTQADLANALVSIEYSLRPIHVAISHHHLFIFEMLLTLGANPELREGENGYSALTMAIVTSCTAAALRLIQLGVDLYTPNNHGRSPMYIAVERGLTDVIYALIFAGVPVDANVTIERSPHGTLTALHVAILHKQHSALSLLLNMCASITIKSGDGYSVLHLAVMANNEYAVLKLLEMNATVSYCPKGRNPIYYACEKGYNGILLAFAQSHRAFGLPLDQPVTSAWERPASMMCPLHVAAKANHPHTVSMPLIQ